MEIIILILLLYSFIGFHLTFTLGYFHNRPITTGTDKFLLLIAIILYCVATF